MVTNPDGSTCTLSSNATGTMADRNVYVDLVCVLSGEVCNGLDDDGDGEVDEGLDADADGVNACGPDGLTGTPDDDCDDGDTNVLPGAAEVCGNDVDDDCDPGTADLFDFDEDGADCVADCDDEDATVSTPGPELCNGLDDDCDTFVDPAEVNDLDGDGLADACDTWVDVACAAFTVGAVGAVMDTVPGAICLTQAQGPELPQFLTNLGFVLFSGVAVDWGPGAVEIAAAGQGSTGEALVSFAGIGCNDDQGNGECAAAGRPDLAADLIVTEQQQWACEEVAVAGCGALAPRVLF